MPRLTPGVCCTCRAIELPWRTLRIVPREVTRDVPRPNALTRGARRGPEIRGATCGTEMRGGAIRGTEMRGALKDGIRNEIAFTSLVPAKHSNNVAK